MFAATEEMARISIEASAALAGWIALHRRVRGGGLSFAHNLVRLVRRTFGVA